MKKDKRKGRVIIVSAPSGSGKTSIVKYILKHQPGLEFSISATSRQPRYGERHGVDYYFLTADEFREKIDNNDFVEWEEVYENIFYGTLRSEIKRIWEKGSHIIFDVDVKGGISLKKEFGERAISLFIEPPSIDELRKRLMKRGTDHPKEIEMRINKANEEMADTVSFDEVIINDNLDKACNEAFLVCKGFLSDNG